MNADDRRAAMHRHPLVVGADPAHRDLIAAAVAEAESTITAALSLWVQGESTALRDILAASGAPSLAGIPIVAAFCAAREALDAAVGDDPSRGMAAVMVLQERAAEYAALAAELTRHAAGNGR